MKERSKGTTGAGEQGSSSSTVSSDKKVESGGEGESAEMKPGKSCQEFPNQLSIPFSNLTFPMTKVSTPIIDFYKGKFYQFQQRQY